MQSYTIQIILPAANGRKSLEVFFLFEIVCILRGGSVVFGGGGVGGVDIIAGFEVALEFDIEDGKAVKEHAAKLNLFF
jgi:hypothetical protein